MTSRFDRPLLVLLGAVCALFLLRAFVPAVGPFAFVLGGEFLSYVGGTAKLAALAAGGVSALRVARSFGVGNPARFAWRALALWLLSWTAGQAALCATQWILREEMPFPSLGDPFFVVGYLAMVVGFTGVLRAHVGSGLAFGDGRTLALLGAGTALVALVTGLVVLHPIASAGGTAVELALNLMYPACDLVALVPASVLVRMTFAMRGGALFRIWSLLLSGFLAMAVGDVLYAYLTMLDLYWTSPIVDLSFIVGYALAARGVVEQRRLTS